MSRGDFQGRITQHKAAARRLKDAWAILEKGPEHAQCAKYLGGYAVECKLKAIAMEIYNCWTLEELADRLHLRSEDVFSHNLERLAKRLTNLYGKLRDGEVGHSFVEVNKWKPAWRYEPGQVNRKANESAKDFLSHVCAVYNWLDRNRG
jgi:adenosyl cobinamide kinase/adenosyl cobinamide phosphate guanylyltransferase